MSTLRISRRAADRLRAGHLWVYRSDLEPAGPEHGSPEPGNPGPAEPAPGALVTLVDARDIPLGTALYSSGSQIAARLVSRTPGIPRQKYLTDVRTRVEAALQLRRALAPVFPANRAHNNAAADSDAQRLIFAEADDLPGIVADRYNDLVLLQLLTQGTAQDDVRATLATALRAALSPNGEPLTVWERPDPRIRELEQLDAPPSRPLFTTADSIAPDGLSFRTSVEESASHKLLAPSTTTFTLNGLRFHYDAGAGQKTGAFLDQRLNYAAAAAHVAASVRAQRTSGGGLRGSGRALRALDICTYQGGFALHLAQVCARVTGVDTSRAALEAADRNLLLNPQLSAHCELDWIEADAFDLLRALDRANSDRANLDRINSDRVNSDRANLDEANQAASRRQPAPAKAAADSMASTTAPDLPLEAGLFDAIVLDPPAFAKSKRAAEGALRGYKELNLRAIRLLAPGGTLITCSCSHHVSLAEFTAVVAAAASDAGRRVQLLETRAAAPDHPEVITLPETRYLKCLICRVD